MKSLGQTAAKDEEEDTTLTRSHVMRMTMKMDMLRVWGEMLGWWVGGCRVGWGYNSSVLHFLGTKTKFHVTLFLETDSTIC